MVSYIILNWLEKIVWSNKSLVWGVNVMDYLKRHKKILICIILGLLLIKTELYIVVHKICNDVRLEYEPVQILTKPKGMIYSDGGAFVSFSIKNCSDYEQTVAFIIYQQNWVSGEKQLFIVEHVYNDHLFNNPKEIKDGVIKIPGDESCIVSIEAVAKDKQKILSSREGPNVKIVKLN
mgnify:CR=1 FL=1